MSTTNLLNGITEEQRQHVVTLFIKMRQKAQTDNICSEEYPVADKVYLVDKERPDMIIVVEICISRYSDQSISDRGFTASKIKEVFLKEFEISLNFARTAPVRLGTHKVRYQEVDGKVYAVLVTIYADEQLIK